MAKEWTVESISVVPSRPEQVSVSLGWDVGGAEAFTFTKVIQSNVQGLKNLREEALKRKLVHLKSLTEATKLTAYRTAILNALNG